ncbi:hypothetical protein [Actinomadura rudentiformis]|uniref:Uncharacterized protein n=1 Tax=Actinomadura rudentiformis TaxID=359158 RepID=A0A6H9Z381_9ACTN|nr:hypothetical protein [Actinomadura rudentiformis]KAB2347810.1 hypothetical protein F8566_18125 [Actinomadura rudentiformis]
MKAQIVLVRGGAGVVGCALLAAAMWFHSLKPKVEADVIDPIRTSGKVGKVITNRDFKLQIERVVVARSLKQGLSSSTQPPVATEGIFVVVSGRAMSQKKPISLNTAVLETRDGYKYRKAQRPGVYGALDGSDFAPLLWGKLTFYFEIPKHRLAGARVVVRQSSLFLSPDAATEVDLGISESRAEEMIRGAAQNYDLSGRRP